MYSEKRKSRSGFTLLEVMVASTVSLMLALTLFNAFFQSNKALAHSTTRIDAFQRTRLPAERVASYLNSAVSIPSLDTIVYPQQSLTANPTIPNLFGGIIYDDDPKTWDQLVFFRTTEDFLATTGTVGYDFDPEAIMIPTDIKNNLDVWERDDQRLTEYVIWFEDDTNIDWIPNTSNVIAMARLNDNTVSDLRNEAWVRAWFSKIDPKVDFQPGIAPFIIAKNVDDFRVRRRIESTIQVAVTAEQKVRNVSGSTDTKTFRYDAMVQTPTIQMNF